MRIKRSLMNIVLRHCQEAVPEEACGVLSGPEGGEPDTVHVLRNVALHPRYRYAFDPDDQRGLWRALEAADQRPLVIFHSHVGRDAEPSYTDIRYAMLDQSLHHMIVSVPSGAAQPARLWTVTADGQPNEVPLEILDD